MSVRRMPVLFIGHGSPMNALEENTYTKLWRQLGQTLPRPKAILMISAHWYTGRTMVTAMEKPRTILDFGGFPQALFEAQYNASGSPQLAQKVADLLAPVSVALDKDWGLDHGAWSVLIKMYPNADIPVVQLSIDASKSPLEHYELGQKLNALRDQEILIVGSGNVVHNLRALKWRDDSEPYAWAQSFNQYVRDNVNWKGPTTEHPLVNFMQHEGAKLSNPTPDHYLPMLYALGTRQDDESVSILIDGLLMGSLSMFSVKIG